MQRGGVSQHVSGVASPRSQARPAVRSPQCAATLKPASADVCHVLSLSHLSLTGRDTTQVHQCTNYQWSHCQALITNKRCCQLALLAASTGRMFPVLFARFGMRREDITQQTIDPSHIDNQSGGPARITLLSAEQSDRVPEGKWQMEWGMRACSGKKTPAWCILSPFPFLPL